jgi:molecular chaperone DnaK
VSAKDKATGKEQSIVIKASSGLSDDEVDQMIKDAEAHAGEDKKLRELVDARNAADGMIHATEKSIKDLGDKIDASEKSAAEAAIAELKEAVKGDDKDLIEAKTSALTEAASKIAEKAYAQQAEATGAGGAEGAGAGDAGAAQGGSSEEVVDAEFEEVKDNENK